MSRKIAFFILRFERKSVEGETPGRLRHAFSLKHPLKTLKIKSLSTKPIPTAITSQSDSQKGWIFFHKSLRDFLWRETSMKRHFRRPRESCQTIPSTLWGDLPSCLFSLSPNFHCDCAREEGFSLLTFSNRRPVRHSSSLMRSRTTFLKSIASFLRVFLGWSGGLPWSRCEGG